MAIGPRLPEQCCRSSVVERILGKAEVVSSILTGSTILRPQRGRCVVPLPVVMNKATTGASASAVCQAPGGLIA